MGILDPDSDISVIVRRDKNASAALPAIAQMCVRDTLLDGESRAEMFARKAYEIADAMERERQKGGEV